MEEKLGEDELTNAGTLRLAGEHGNLFFQCQLSNPVLCFLKGLFPANASRVCYVKLA
jgi:hypothetical protein